jgi:hypothetical protein
MERPLDDVDGWTLFDAAELETRDWVKSPPGADTTSCVSLDTDDKTLEAREEDGLAGSC